MKKKILVTGAAGYIGSKLCTQLVNLGFKVVAVDILKYDQNSLLHLFCFKNFKFIKADITRPLLIKKLLKGCDFIIPLAALVGAPLCERYKKQAKKVNVVSIKYILKYINSKQKIIYPTTNSGYGIGQKNKFCTEETSMNPISLYGRTKVIAEKIIMRHHNSISFRLATVFGYSYRMRTDLLVNNFVEKSVKNKRLDLFEPHFRRNYIHINDVVSAFIYAIKNFNNLKGQVYNLGLSDANLTKIALAKKIQKKIKSLKIVIKKYKSDPDKRDYYVSNKKIEKTGFRTKVKIDEGIGELINIFTFSKKKYINNY
jgi:nucleoside-diphosphate-sugar epimerase